MATVSALRLVIDARGAAAGAAAFSRATGQVTTSATAAATATKGLMASMKPLAAFVGIAATVKTIAQFEEKMALAGKVSGATGQTLVQLTAKARELGATTRFTGAQAAEGLLELARAGFTARESMLAIADSLDLATAGGLQLGEATGFMSNAIRQFGLDANEAARVADTFVVISNNANTDVRQLAEALKYSGTVAAALGQDIETTAAAIGVLGDRGVQGSMAGTQLRGTLLALASPTDAAAAGLAKLGLTLDSVNPATHNLLQIAQTLGRGIDSLANPLEAAGIFSEIFGRRNAAAAIAMADANEKMADSIELAKASGAAHSDLAATMQNTIIGKALALKSAVEEVMLSMGDRGLGGAIKGMLDLLTDATRMLGGVEGAFNDSTTGAKLLTFAIVALTAKMVIMRTVFIGSWLVGFGAGFGALIVKITLTAALTGTFTGTIWALTAAMLANPATWLALAIGAVAGALFLSTGRANDNASAMADLADEERKVREEAQATAFAVGALSAALEMKDRGRTVEALIVRISQLKELQEAMRTDARTSGIVSGEVLQKGLARTVAKKAGKHEMAFDLPAARGRGALGAADLYDKAAAQAKVTAELEKYTTELKALDVVSAAIAAGTDTAAASLEDWQRKMAEGTKAMQSLGATAAETALWHETLTVAQEMQGESTRKLSITEIGYIFKEISARKIATDAVAAQAAAEQEAGALAMRIARETELAANRAATATANRLLANEQWLASLSATYEMTRLKALGLNDLATQLEITAELTRRGIDLESEMAVAVRTLLTEQAAQNAVTADGTVKLSEAEQAIQRFELRARAQGIALEELKGIQHLHADAYEIAAAKAQIYAEAESLVIGKSREEAAAIRNAAAALAGYVEVNANLSAQRELTQGVQDAWGNMFIGIIDGSKTAAEAFEDFGKRTMSMIMDMVVKKALMNAMFGDGSEGASGFLSFLAPAAPTGAARGAWTDGAAGSFKSFARGGVVNSRTRFNRGHGNSFEAGEAGRPEAVLQLHRDGQGVLGVKTTGGAGGGKNVTVNMTVNTQDADSFRRSKIQIQNDLRTMTTQID